jgi:SAM-dependent methyltransferase
MPDPDPGPAPLLRDYLPLLEQVVTGKGILDLACGSGRNGIFLVEHNLPVVFADINPAALEKISGRLADSGTAARYWEVDFENPDSRPLVGKEFDAILVFNYLHRPLIPDIGNSVKPGGLLFYETFTAGQATVGRPSNPDYLLQPGELRDWFEDWEILHYFEGAGGEPRKFYANLAARKPL